MAMQQYAYKKDQNNRYQAKTESNMYEYIEDTGKDPHTYMASGTLADSTDSSTGNLNGGVTLTTSKTSYRQIYLAMFGGMVLGAVISTLTATIVYHVVDEGRQIPQDHGISLGTNVSHDLIRLLNASQTDMNYRIEILADKQQAFQQRQNVLGHQVAFTAHTVTGTLVDRVLRFQDVILNAGDGYDQTSGTFTSPMAGTYLFPATLISVKSRTNATLCSILKNRDIVTSAYSHEGQYDSVSQTVLLHLVVGDKVELGKCYNVDAILTGDKDCTFIGSLIQAD